MLKVTEDSARCEQRKDFPIKLALSFMGAVVNGEAGDDGVEGAELWQRAIEVVLDDVDMRMSSETLSTPMPMCISSSLDFSAAVAP